MRAARQSLARSLEEVDAFLDDWNPTPPWKAVVKPLDSAGSDDVHLVESREEARKCFQIIDGKVTFAFSLSCLIFIFIRSCRSCRSSFYFFGVKPLI